MSIVNQARRERWGLAMDNKSIPNSLERTCVECGKQFLITSQWAYRLVIKGDTEYFCRYNCMRSGEKRHKDARAGRKKELKSKKPSKAVLESDLRSGLPIVNIAKKHGSSVQSVHNWIKSYELAGIQGKKKDVASVAPVAPTVFVPKRFELEINAAEVVDKYGPFLEGTDVDEMVQESPTLRDIEQFHMDEPIQELPKVEFDPPKSFANINDALDAIHEVNHPEDYETCNDREQAAEDDYSFEDVTPTTPEPDTEPTIDELLKAAEDTLTALKKKYVEQAEKDFKSQLIQLIRAVTKGSDLFV